MVILSTYNPNCIRKETVVMFVSMFLASQSSGSRDSPHSP